MVALARDHTLPELYLTVSGHHFTLLYVFLIPLCLELPLSHFDCLFYLAIGHGMTPLPLLGCSALILYLIPLPGLSPGGHNSTPREYSPIPFFSIRVPPQVSHDR